MTTIGARLILEKPDYTVPYDVLLMIGCTGGRLRCLAVSPELIHHQRRSGEATVSTKKEDYGAAAVEGTDSHFFTFNIQHSARCNWNRSDTDLVQCLPTMTEREYLTT